MTRLAQSTSGIDFGRKKHGYKFKIYKTYMFNKLIEAKFVHKIEKSIVEFIFLVKEIGEHA